MSLQLNLRKRNLKKLSQSLRRNVFQKRPSRRLARQSRKKLRMSKRPSRLSKRMSRSLSRMSKKSRRLLMIFLVRMSPQAPLKKSQNHHLKMLIPLSLKSQRKRLKKRKKLNLKRSLRRQSLVSLSPVNLLSHLSLSHQNPQNLPNLPRSLNLNLKNLLHKKSLILSLRSLSLLKRKNQ